MRARFLCLLFPFSLFAQSPFLQDSATAYLKTLCVEIGPRPMGSPNERRAMEFTLTKFHQFGLDEAYFLEMRVAGSAASAANTRSGVAVGVLKGMTHRIILIGGHIDSAGPDIPGANDDGSGSATVIELARVFAHSKHQSTLVFCLFGGEESNLRGSRFFAERFPDTSKIALMLQVDMANGADWLLPMFETHTTSAPQWLVRAAYEEFNKLPYSGLYYPSHFYTINYAFPGIGAGSDHEPFLEKGIPSIDFTSDPNEPIHVPEDNFENFKPFGLKRSGDLVYNLVNRFDGGVPVERTGSFFTVQIGRTPFLIPLVILKVVILLALLAAGVGVVQTRRRRVEITRSDTNWKKIPALKLFTLALLVQTCVWLSENVVGLLKGVRYPWYAAYDGYFVLGFLAAVVGVWLSLQIVPRIGLSRDPYRYFVRAVGFFTFFIVLSGMTTARMAVYPAVGLLLISCAMLIQHPLLKLILWIASPHLMYRLLFNEAYGLVARGFVESPGTSLVAALTTFAFILIFALWSFPFLLGFAAIYFDSGVDLLWLKKFRNPLGIAASGFLFFAFAFYLAQRPTFSNQWKQRLHVNQTIDVASGNLEVRLSSGEYLKSTTVRWPSSDSLVNTNVTDVRLQERTNVAQDWLHVEREVSPSKHDSVSQIDFALQLRTKFRPYQLDVTYSIAKGSLITAASPFAVRQKERSATMRWYSFPDTALFVPIRLEVAGADSVTETVEATFVEQFTEVRVSKPNATPQYRTIIRETRSLGLP